MKRHHKWFRKERYKQKLERDVDKHKTYYSNVYFTTKEPDPVYIERRLREHRPAWYTEEQLLEKLTRPEPGKNYYVYYDRPSVPYTARYYYKKAGRSKHQKFLKKATSRRVRRDFKQKGEIYQHNQYRRVQEFWWELD